MGWETNRRCYAIYGKPGGPNEVIAITECIIEGIEEEEELKPFNFNPNQQNADPELGKCIKTRFQSALPATQIV